MKTETLTAARQPTLNSPLAEEILALSARIAKKFHPRKIILFGSHAYGAPGPDSDVDLLVIMPFEGKSAHQAAEIRFHTNPGFALDLLVRTPDKIEERLAIDDFFIREILEKGVVLY